MAPVLIPIDMKPSNSYFNYLHAVWIVAVQSALKHTSNVITQLQLGDVGNHMQHSCYQSETVSLPLTTTVDIQKPQIYAMEACNPNNDTLVSRILCSGSGFVYIPSVGGLKFVPAEVGGDDGVELVVGARCQVELLPDIVDEEFWFEDIKVPQCMPLQSCMLHIPVDCYPYGTVCIFIGEVNAGWTHLHKLFLLPRSPLVVFLDC
jgi:hypothetical protein